MSPTHYHVAKAEEDRKQLYWGAVLQGAVAFHQQVSHGVCLTARAMQELALRRFEALFAHSDALFVDDWCLGLACFTEGFMAGYQQRADRTDFDGLAPQAQRPALKRVYRARRRG